MPDALLVSDQHIPEGFFGAPNIRRGSSGFLAPDFSLGTFAGTGHDPSVPAFLTTPDYQSMPARPHPMIGTRITKSVPEWSGKRNDAAVSSGRDRAIRAVTYLKEQTRRSSQKEQTDREMRWLADNRHRYAGQWIAIQGDTLLAAGASAKQVFAKVADQPIPPLVIRVDDEDRPSRAGETWKL